MKKALLVIIVLSAIYIQKSAAQANDSLRWANNSSKQISSLIGNAGLELKHRDTLKAVADIKLAETFLPLLSAKAALSLKNKITAFYLEWVKLKYPPSRGRPDEHSVQIYSLLNRLNARALRANQETGFFSNAIKLAALANNKPFYIYAKTGYAESLVKTPESGEAIRILDSLSDEPSLSSYEKMHILSLLLINSVKLDRQKNLAAYYKQLQALNKVTNGKLDQQEYLMATAMYFDEAKAYTRAIAQYETFLSRYAKPANNNEQLADGMIRLASLLAKLQKPDSAAYYFNKAHQIIKDNKGFKEAAILYNLAFGAYQKRLSKASVTDGKLLAADAAYRSRLENATRQLEYRYRIELQGQKLRLVSQQRQLELLKYTRDRQQSILIILSLLLLVIAAGTLSYVLFQRRKQSQLLHAAEVERIKQSHHIEVIKVLAKAREDEQNRIAGRLHDEVGSMLAVARLNLSVIDEPGINTTTITAAQLNAANIILGNLAATIREMSHELMPVAIRQLGLKKSIQQLIDDINTSNKISIECVIVGLDDNSKYPFEFQTNIYRIIQELFQNIIKHARATHAAFQLVEHADALNLMIEDNGTGIDPAAKNNGKGIGLISNRVGLYHGKITIEPGGNNGTLIIIDIPLQNIVYSGFKNDPEHSETLPRG